MCGASLFVLNMSCSKLSWCWKKCSEQGGMLSCTKQTDGMSARPISSSGLLWVEKSNRRGRAERWLLCDWRHRHFQKWHSFVHTAFPFFLLLLLLLFVLKFIKMSGECRWNYPSLKTLLFYVAKVEIVETLLYKEFEKRQTQMSQHASRTKIQFWMWLLFVQTGDHILTESQ